MQSPRGFRENDPRISKTTPLKHLPGTGDPKLRNLLKGKWSHSKQLKKKKKKNNIVLKENLESPFWGNIIMPT